MITPCSVGKPLSVHYTTSVQPKSTILFTSRKADEDEDSGGAEESRSWLLLLLALYPVYERGIVEGGRRQGPDKVRRQS